MIVTLCLSCYPDVGVNSIGAFRGPPRSGVASLPHLVSSCLEFCWQLLWHPTQLNYIIIQRPHDRPLDLWNRMFNRHQAEITSGASLYWHNGTFTLSHIISLNPPTRSLSITGHWNVLLPSGVSPWNSIFGPGRRSKYNVRLDILSRAKL